MIQIQDNSRTNNDDLSVQAPVTNKVSQDSAAIKQTNPVATVSPAPVASTTDNPIQGLVGDVKAPVDKSMSVTETETVPTDNTNNQSNEAEINDLLAQLEKLSQEIEKKAETDEKVVSDSIPKQEEVLTTVPDNNEFDMDKFLKDLEQKIEADNSSDDYEPTFRKNRVVDKGGVEFDLDEEDLAQEPKEIPQVKTAPVANKQDLVKEVDELLDEAMKMEPSVKVADQDQPPKKLKEQDLVKEVDELLGEAMNMDDTDKEEDQAREEIADVEPNSVSDTDNIEEKEELPQSLESQSVFEMLNIDDITAEEREEFLSELEDLIWDDFIKTDLPLMLTNDEYKGAEEILNSQKSEDQKKEAILIYVEKILPDIEELMYEKAIGLKEEMFMERVRKMEEAAVGDQDILNAIEQVKKLVQVGQWKTAVETLNQA